MEEKKIKCFIRNLNNFCWLSFLPAESGACRVPAGTRRYPWYPFCALPGADTWQGTRAQGHAGTGTRGHRDTRAQGHAGTGTRGQRDTRAKGHAGKGTRGQRDTRAKGHAGKGTRGQRDTRAKGHAGKGTRGQRDTRVKGHRHTGTRAGTGKERYAHEKNGRHRGIRTGTRAQRHTAQVRRGTGTQGQAQGQREIAPVTGAQGHRSTGAQEHMGSGGTGAGRVCMAGRARGGACT